MRSDITRALTALDLTTVNDIQQTSAALAQCTVSRMEGGEGGMQNEAEQTVPTERANKRGVFL